MKKSKSSQILILLGTFIGILALFYGIFYFSNILLKISPFDSGNIFLTNFMLYTLFLIIAIILSEKIFKHKESQRNINYDTYKIFLIITSSLLVAHIIAYILYKYVRLWHHDIVFDANGLNTFNIILAAISGWILAPCSEEILFRKIVFSILSKRNIKPTIIILFSGIIFGIIHSSTLHNMVNATISGICFAYVYYKTQNIIFPILAHSINNISESASSIFYYFKFRNNLDLNYIERYGADITSISSTVFVAILCIVSFIAYYMHINYKKGI